MRTEDVPPGPTSRRSAPERYHDAVEWRRNATIVHIDLRSLHIGLRGCDGGERRLGVFIGRVVFLLADDLGLIKLGLPAQGDLGELSRGNRFCVIGLRLSQCGLEGTLVDGKRTSPSD